MLLYCNGKKDFCHEKACDGKCQFYDGSGSKYKNPDTNADRIRAMCATDEGIAKIILSLDLSLSEDGKEFTHLYCDGKNNCITEDDSIICTDEMRKSCIIRWLREPANATTTATMTEEDKLYSGLIEEE